MFNDFYLNRKHQYYYQTGIYSTFRAQFRSEKKFIFIEDPNYVIFI